MSYVRNNAPGLSTDQLLALGANKISPNRVQSRTDTGKKLSYVEAWDVKATLIKVFGFGGFSTHLLEAKILSVTTAPQAKNKDRMNQVVIAQATVRLTIHATGAEYEETATGQNAQPDLGMAMDTALKSAESDALKRAALFLGTQFGLSLYGKTTDDVCRPILEPEQKERIAMALADRAAATSQAVQEHLDRVTGRENPNIGVAEDAASEEANWKPEDESQDTPAGEASDEQA